MSLVVFPSAVFRHIFNLYMKTSEWNNFKLGIAKKKKSSYNTLEKLETYLLYNENAARLNKNKFRE